MVPEKNPSEYISLQDAAKYCQYSQEYLSLRARHGKLKAVKFGRNWVTKREWLAEYLKRAKENNNSNGKKFFISSLTGTIMGRPLADLSATRGYIREPNGREGIKNGSRTFFLLLISFFVGLVLSFFLFYFLIYAAPPGSPYNPGETLAPDCAPGAPNCTVYPPVPVVNNQATIGEDKLAGIPNTAGAMKLFSAGDNALYTTFTAIEQTANADYTLPISLPDANKILQSTATGTLSWVSNAAGGAPVGEAYVTIGNTANLSAERALTGTADQITVTDGGANSTVTLALANPTTFPGGITVQGTLARGANAITGTGDIGVITTGYVANSYLSHIHLNDTVYLDGASAGVAALTGSLTITKDITAAGQTHLLITDEAGGTISFLEGETGAGKFYPVINATSLGVSGAGVLLVGQIPAAQDSYVAGLAAVSIAGRRTGDVALAGADLFNVRNYNTVEFRIDKDGYGYIDRLYLNSTAYLDGAVGGTIAIPGTGGITLGEDIAGGTPNTAGTVKLFSAGDNAFYTTFTAATQTANATYTLPTAMPGSNMVLQSTSAGVLSWVSTVAPSAHNILSAAHGDTAAATVVRGDIIVGNATPAWSRLAKGSTGQLVTADATDVVWTTATYPATTTAYQLLVSTATNVIGGLTVGTTGQILRGATGAVPTWTTTTYPATTTAYTLAVATATNVMGELAVGTTGKILQGVTGAVPAWSTATYPSTATTTGAYLRADGTNWISSTLILPNAGTAYKLAAYTATNTLTELAAVGATGQMLLGATGAIPAWSTLTMPATLVVGSVLATNTANILSAVTSTVGLTVLQNNAGAISWATSAAPDAHALLSAFHSDTTAGTVVRGDIITGQGVAPTWTKLALDTVGKILRSDGTDLAYSTATYPATTTAYQLLVSTATNVIGGLTVGTTGQILRGATGAVPTWTTTTYPATTTAYTLAVATATNVMGELAVGTTGKVLQGVTGAVPAWSTATYPSTATTTGAYLRADGTNWISSTLILPNAGTAYKLAAYTATNTLTELVAVGATGTILTGVTGAIPVWTTATYPATTTAYQLLVSTATNVIGGLTVGTTGQILRGATGAVPTWTTTTYPATTTAYTLAVATATNVMGELAVGTTGKILQGVTGAVPAWSTATYPSTATTTGAYLRADGTNWITSTLILPNAITDTYVLVATAANTIGSDAGLTYDDVADTLTVAGAVNPDAVGGATLGTASAEWGNVYISSDNTLSLGDAQQISMYYDTALTDLVVLGLTGSATGPYLRYSTSTNEVWYDSSSERYKEDIQPLEDDFAKILQVEPKSFIDKNSQQREIGYIAEEFQKLGLTNLLYYDSQGLPMSIKYEKISLYLVEIAKLQQQEIEEIKALLNPEGAAATANSSSLGFLDKLKQDLAALGLTIENGIVQVKELVAERIFAQKIRTNELEMVDKATGEIYCTWIENGEWMKVKGECNGSSPPSPPPPAAPPSPPDVPTVEQPPVQEQPVSGEPQPDTSSQISSPEPNSNEAPIE